MAKPRASLLFLLIFVLSSGCSHNLPERPLPVLPEAPVEGEALAQNNLIHIFVSFPAGWISGAGGYEHVTSDFPMPVPLDYDYAVFSNTLSRSMILVGYRPLAGGSYFGDQRKAAEWYRGVLLKKYDERNIKIAEGSGRFYMTGIEGVPYYVIQNDIVYSPKDKRRVYTCLYIPEDVRSLYIFGFSAPLEEGIELEEPFQDFINIVSGFKINPLDPYEEALYRDEDKLWMGLEYINPAFYYNAMQDEVIEELKAASIIKPDMWEPHYRLARMYGSSYLLTDREAESLPDAEREELRQVRAGGKDAFFSPNPINGNGAIAGYERFLKANPEESEASRWLKSMPSIPELFASLGEALISLARFDEAISCLEEGIKKGASDAEFAAMNESLSINLGHAYWRRARVGYNKEDFDGAIRDYRAAIELLKNRGAERWEEHLWKEIAGAYAKKGMKKEAFDSYSKALEFIKKGGGDKKTEDELKVKLKELG